MLELRRPELFSGIPAVNNVTFLARSEEVTGYLDRMGLANQQL